jgi:hypothetical protein
MNQNYANAVEEERIETMKIRYTLSAVILVCLFTFIGCEEKTIEIA